MSNPHRFWNMYLTAAVSVTLVLCLVGMECVLLLSASSLLRRMQENMTLTAVFRGSADSSEVQPDSATLARFESMLSAADYCSDYRYISADEALEEHIATLGEDPSLFLGYNPLSASYEIHPTAAYASPDSMQVIESRLTALPYVEKVLYPQDLVRLMNSNVSQVSIAMLIVGVALLLIAFVLISNTIRLQIYARRFLINTMTLVGATAWSIKSPFIRRYVGMGALCAVVAAVIVTGVVYYVNTRLGVLLFAYSWQNICFVCGVLLLSGVLITLFASLLATSRYVRMDIDTLYEI